MQQPQSRPLLGDSVSSTTSPNARPRNNPVAVLTQQQLQQLQQLQAQNTSGQSLTFALQQTSSNPQEQGNGSTTGNHIVYVNQLNQLNQSTINPSGTGMGLPPATPTFGVGLNMGLPLSLLNTSLTSLTSNVITTSNPLLNLGLPSINTGLTAINPSLNHLNAINSNLTSNIGSNNINNGLSNLGQDLSSINTGVNTGINRLNTINSTNINSGLSGVNAGLTGVNPNLTTLNSSSVNQNLTLNTNLTATNSGVSGLSAINPNTNLTTTSINSGVNQGLNRPVNALATGLTPTSLNSSSAQFSFPTIQSIQSIAPHIVGSSNIAHVPNSAISQHPNTNISTISPISNSGTLTSSSIFTSTPSESIHATTANVNHASNVNLTTNIAHLGTMHANLSNISTSNVHISASNEPTMSLSHVSSLSSSQSTGFQPQRQYSQGINPGLSASVALTGTTQPSNVVSTMNTVKSMQNIQNQNISSPGSPFSIPLKSPASNIAPPTPSPSPNRLLLRSPASNSIQSNRNSPSPVGTSTSNSNFNIQMQSPMQSPMSVSQIQSPVLSPYPPAKSPHLLGGNNSLNNRSPAPGGSPGPPVVRPNTPILQQGMQVLQIIHGTPQGYQSTPTQLVTRTQLFGNQQIQIAAAKPAKQPPQILPKPPNQQAATSQQKPQRATTTITNQVTQQTQPQLVLAGPQPSPTTATMIPTAQGLLLNQVLPSTGPVIVQQQPGGVQLILRTPASAQQQTHTAQLTQQQLVRVVTAQGMQLQGITPAFFAVPNGFPPTASPVIRHTPSSPAPSNSGTGNSIVIQNAMVQSPQSQIAQVTSGNTTGNASCTQTVSEQNLLPPPKKKAKKKKKAKRKDDEPPKLDLASIMKISGIGDDDDIFDTELTTETEVPCQVSQQSETNSGQSLGQLSSQGTIPTNSTQNLIQVPATNTTNTQASVSQTFNSQLVAQLQMPVQNAISGQLRLAVGEDGKVVLHHTPEPNQPEIDSATAQALIRSLTQGSGQNSQIISQLFGQAQNTPQPAQSTTQQRPKFVKSPLSSGNQVSTNTISSTCSQNIICTTSPHHSQICSKPMNQQKNINIVSQETNSIPSVCVQNNLGPLQSLEIQTSKNVNVQNLMQSKSSNPTLSQSGNVSLNTSDILSAKPSPTMFNIQGPRMSNTNQTNSNQQNSNISLQKSSQVRLTNACITTNVRQNLGKQTQQQQHGVHMQKSLPGSSIVQNDHVSKANQSLQQTSQQETLTLQQESPLFQHNQQITAQTVQTQNVQQIFEQNLQSSNIHHNSMNILQQQSSCNTMQQHDSMNVLHSSIQQNTINVLQQNTAGNVQNIEQNLQSGTIKDIAHTQQNVMTSLQQQNTSAVLHNTSVQQNVNVQQQKVVTANTFSSVNAHHFESQNSANVLQQGINTQQNNQNQNILITTTPASNTPTQQNESQKVESQGANILNSAANNILNNAPKITPEILNALSNLNPNDQLLIANANGQMQVISQQLLQQFLAGQLNATNQTQNQNQTQKIVIGEPDANNQNLQGVQINTPTSQIIVNSSGGAPTIQNNIQNIVVQAAPSQMPPHIQIQNSSFPSQFIDNLNQQQIKNLGNNQPKKAKIVKKTKVAVTAQSIVNSQTTKTVTVTRPTMVAANTSNLQKVDNLNKTNTMVSQNTNPAKSESAQVIANGPLVSSSASSHVSVPSNGQMVQRIQTIQLPAQKQQMLKNIQSQIQTILSRKSVTPSNPTLRKLYEEQARILASGKIVSSTTHPVNSAAEPTFNVSLVSTVASNVHLQNSFKNQTSATQTQTQTSTIAMPVTSQSLNSTTSATMPSNTNINYINITSINCTSPNVQGQQPTISNTATQSIHQSMHTKQHKFYQNHGNQMLNPSSANMQIFSPPITSATAALQLQSNAQQLTQVQTQQQQTSMQQSTQCQTDPLDIKPNIQTPSPVKQELSSPIQVQIQSGSPAGQVTSPRMIGKGTQRIQSPVNTGGNTTKQLISPNSNSSPLISPRQGVKRRATSPICRQLNRGDLLEQQLKIDQNGATNPDMNTPFSSKRDACKRLVRYHCLNEQVLSPKDLAKADERFEETAKHLLGKFSAMMNKYTYLLLMESMREVRTSELMMIDRTFVAEEQNILNRLREQEAKVNEEFKKEEKPIVPKVEPGLIEEDKSTLTSPPLVNVSVKRELEDDFPSDEMECKPVIKTTSSTSGDYDEWLEIQKELGVYPSTAETLRCKTGNNGNSGNSACAVTAVTRSSKIERTRANGECLRANVPSVSNMIMKDDCEQDVTPTPFDRRWSSATDLERDLLEDADSLDGLALHSQAQCPSSTVHVTSSESGNAGNEHDEITAQVQSAIDSILNLKKRPANTLSGSSSGSSSSQSGESKDTALDQAVRSILGS